MTTATVTSKGQITVPADVRADLRLHAGDQLSFEKVGEGVYQLRPLRADVMRLAGIFRHAGPRVSIEDMDRAIADAAAEAFRLGSA